VSQVTPELQAAIERGYAQRDRANMGPTIAYFEALLAEHPDHPVLVYEVAGAYDTAGQEATARELYERALDLGLAGTRCVAACASTAARCAGWGGMRSRWRSWTGPAGSSPAPTRSASFARSPWARPGAATPRSPSS